MKKPYGAGTEEEEDSAAPLGLRVKRKEEEGQGREGRGRERKQDLGNRKERKKGGREELASLCVEETWQGKEKGGEEIKDRRRGRF